ncbi:MAG: M1 family aminopeptidase [Bacteroidota bacterium]
MKFQTIYVLEFGYQVRRPATWLYFVALLVIAYLIVIANYSYDARDGYFLLNAPIVIASVTVITSVFWVVIGASVAGDAAARDVQTRMHALTYTAPTNKLAYLGGRFVAAFVLNVLISVGIPIGVLLAMHFSGVEAEIMGPFRLASYLTSFFFIAVPNALFATAIQFTVAVLNRRAMGSYLAGVVLFAASYTIWPILEKGGVWGNLADPMSFGPVLNHMSNDWSPLEKNNRLFLPEGTFLANRLLWLAISIGILLFTYFRFRLVFPEAGRKQKLGSYPNQNLVSRERLNWTIGMALPQARGMYGFGTQLHQLRQVTWNAFLQLAKSKTGLPLSAVLALLVGATFQGNLKARGVPLIPRTDFVLDYITGPLAQPQTFWIIIVLLTIFYAGELVWRERETGISEISHTAPVTEWVLFGGRFLALSLLLLVWIAFLMIAAIVFQSGIGGASLEIGLYLQVLFGLQLVDCLLFTLLALLVHVLVNQKFIGHLVALLAYSFIAFANTLGIEHKLLIFMSGPHWTYTEMAGFGNSLAPWLWFKGYWLAWSLLLAVMVVLFWVRGREGSFVSRLHLARKRLTHSTVLVAAVAIGCMLLTGGFIYYNTNILHDYTSTPTKIEQQADYEKRYKRYFKAPQPILSAVKLQVEIYPKKQAVDIVGTYLLLNNTSIPIDSVHLAMGTGVETLETKFNLPFMEMLADQEHGHHIYALENSLKPGDSLRLNFRVKYKSQGFTNNGADGQVQANGTSFRNIEWLPSIGYQPYRELDQAGERKAYGLAPRPATASLYDQEARRYAPFPEQISFEALVGTDPGQQVVAPGTLRKTWTKNNRRYFYYATDAPIRNEYAFFSANYAVKEGKWRNPMVSPAQEVSIQVFYPPGLSENPELMVRSAKASLEYYVKQFGPYPHRQLRFVAHPSYAFGNHASPINITAEEGFFLLNTREDPRGFDLVTAVVAHEVAHQWWGNQLKQAYVEGAGIITESLAWYSAMGVLEDAYGAVQLRRLLDFLREENKTPRTRAASPLLQANDFYQNYRKGPFAMYAMSQYIGRDRVNSALRNLLANHRPGTLPLPTSLDLYGELRAVTPDSVQTLLHDLFKANTFWELEIQTANAKPRKDGKWQVAVNLQAKKTIVDSAGTETIIPMKDWVEIGAFAAAGQGKETGKQLYLQKHLIKPGKQTILLILNEKPAIIGFDPNHLLIDWNSKDNYKGVTSEK